mmetsp:Transcript_36884/g.48468  ORF Transcript_36884/g.48468 Transcript_36884/m.48468 type:complete len:189 (+) Transcript_36884:617-1183(+)|eukprot:CAMPEP_0185585598 /NCGR_PEP_ID=MMETSP0434-20130131/39671_1 /TAXON_ID=626734 ORGANISM="Favella taraikaensis, Strain Fe Narragansett Bay" /NCGR_SAMPLE_ID=MMETSP0434 /ASSEMBLY_ACC=CAM_ASM_000379 /LENGTH=188 /DNA_ID=CAMNT_0028206043 /DNA_START=581 /DNA_END=1150 /DNA_ORIENTATION=-
MVRDFSSVSELQTYLHHVLAVLGCLGGIYIGGVIGAMSNFILITEMTTPMVNTRWLLHFHEQTHLKAYMLAAVGMTVGFLVMRVILMTYLGFFYLVPALAHKDIFSNNSRLMQVVCWMLFTLHVGLLVLNCLWFSKMMVGVSRFLESTKGNAQGTAASAPRNHDNEAKAHQNVNSQPEREAETVPLLA